MSATEIRQAIESILMVADNPVEPSVLAQLLEVPRADVETMCGELAAEYEAAGRGFILARVAGGYRFQSHPDLAPYVERFVLDGQTSRLSSAALETLAIVAYKQPISRMQIAAIRGVNVDGVLRTLQQRGYVDEISRDSGPGNAVLFGTTDLFLERVGLDSTADLPPLGEFVPGADVVEALEDGLRPDPVQAPTPVPDEQAAENAASDDVDDAEPLASAPDADPSVAEGDDDPGTAAAIETHEDAEAQDTVGVEATDEVVEAEGEATEGVVEAEGEATEGVVEAEGEATEENVEAELEATEGVVEAEGEATEENVEAADQAVDADDGDGVVEVVAPAGVDAADATAEAAAGEAAAGDTDEAAVDVDLTELDDVIDLAAQQAPVEAGADEVIERPTELEEELAAIDALAQDIAQADTGETPTWSPAESSVVATVRHDDPPEAEPAVPFRPAPGGFGGAGNEAGSRGQDLASGEDVGPGEVPPLRGPAAGDD